MVLRGRLLMVSYDGGHQILPAGSFPINQIAFVLVGSILMALSACELDTFWKIGLTVFREVNLVSVCLTLCSPKQKLSLFYPTATDSRGGCSWGQNEQLT